MAYMSPEQARGAAVDKRADIWAFGCVLYEMLTGKQAFRGETTSDILAAVLKDEPDWSRIPPRVQPLLRRCLVKDPKHRLRDIGDAMPLLEHVPDTPPRQPWLLIMAALVITLAIIAAVGWNRAARPEPPHPLVQLSAELSPGATIEGRSTCCPPAISPDGTRIAFVEQAAGVFRLATRRLDQNDLAPLAGTEGATRPFFSPDSKWIAFFADGKLKKVAAQGGSPVALCDAPNPRGGSWGDDGNIIAAFNSGLTLVRVPSGGGALTQVTTLGEEKAGSTHVWPQVLPGSQAVLFTGSVGDVEEANIDILSFKTGARKTVARGGYFGRYLPSGHLIYMHEKTLYAAPFDLSGLAVTGPVQPVLDGVSHFLAFGSANFDYSQTGTFIYLNGRGEDRSSIFGLDGAGRIQPLHSRPGFYSFLNVSPDSKRLAFVTRDDQGRPAIWVRDLERGTTSRLTNMQGLNDTPLWTPDGQHIVFESRSQPNPGMYWIRARRIGRSATADGRRDQPVPDVFLSRRQTIGV